MPGLFPGSGAVTFRYSTASATALFDMTDTLTVKVDSQVLNDAFKFSDTGANTIW